MVESYCGSVNLLYEVYKQVVMKLLLVNKYFCKALKDCKSYCQVECFGILLMDFLCDIAWFSCSLNPSFVYVSPLIRIIAKTGMEIFLSSSRSPSLVSACNCKCLVKHFFHLISFIDFERFLPFERKEYVL